MLAGSISAQAPKRSAAAKKVVSDAPRLAAFATAQRHSRIVRTLKIIVPSTAIIMAGAFIGASYVLTPAKVNIKTDDSAVVDGKLVMANPKLEGVTKDNRPYSMSAIRAIQDVKTQDVIELDAISAKLPISTDDWFAIDAPKGTYNRAKNTLKVAAPFTVKTTSGMTAELASAFVDIAKGTLTTSDPVKIVVNGTSVEADSLNVLDKGKVLVFEKRVRMTISPSRLQEIRSSDGE